MDRRTKTWKTDNERLFEEASKLASEHGMVLKPMQCSEDTDEPLQYRVIGPNGKWFKDVYPETRRIYCPDRSKHGPFVGMPRNQPWTIVDFVRICIKAEDAAQRRMKAYQAPEQEGYCNRKTLVRMIADLESNEGITTQNALRDMLTDLRHVADRLKLDFHEAENGSYDVYLEEKDADDFTF